MEECPADAQDVAEKWAALAKLWPNRTHESNWMKEVLCRLTLHRWHRVDVPGPAVHECDRGLLPPVHGDQIAFLTKNGLGRLAIRIFIRRVATPGYVIAGRV
jgi:hypothetical protein